MHVIDEEGLNVASAEVSVQMRTDALRQLDGASQAVAVTVMLSHSRTGLLAAIAAQDLPGIVEFKAKASAIQEMSKQLRLSKEMQLDAAEFVRRAERGLGVGIREGQANGFVTERGKQASRGNRYTPTREVDNVDSSKIAPTDLADKDTLARYIYPVTDGVSDEQFEEALAEAKDEGNLSRANVARKAKAKAAQPLPPGFSPGDLEALNSPPTERPEFHCDGNDGFDDGFRILTQYLKNMTLNPKPPQAQRLRALLQQSIQKLDRLNEGN